MDLGAFPSVISGETVTVLAYAEVGRDDMNTPIYAWAPEQTVGNVLVGPSSTDDLDGSTRPEGVEVVLALHWPKTYTASLRGKRVEVRGTTYEVVGDPQPYTAANTPGAWNRPCYLKNTEG
jgi:hypothetical protein